MDRTIYIARSLILPLINIVSALCKFGTGETATDAAESESQTLRGIGCKLSLWQFSFVRNLKRISFESDSDNKCLAYMVINPSRQKINYSS